MPRAIAFSEFGGPEVLRFIEIDEPKAGPTQVRVRVKAAGVGPFDYKLRRGYPTAAGPAKFPQRVGNEFAGPLDQVGELVTGLSVGDHVIGFTVAQSYAEVLVVDANQVVRKPEGISWEVAGGLSVVGQGAFNYITQLGIQAGETLLVHAAAGGVGSIAVQLAILRGATVIGTASEYNHEYLRSLGALPVNYGAGLVERVRAMAPRGVDAVLDCVGGEATPASVELVPNRQRILTLVDADKAVEKYGIARFINNRTSATLAKVAQLYAEGKLRLPVTTFPWDQAAEAHRMAEKGHVRGKVVLMIQ